MQYGFSIARIVFATAALSCSITAMAQDAEQALDTIVVTGSRISYRDLLDSPPSR